MGGAQFFASKEMACLPEPLVLVERLKGASP